MANILIFTNVLTI